MNRRIVVAIILASILTLILGAEGVDRLIYGSTDPNASVPRVPGPIWTSVASDPNRPECTSLKGATGAVELTWLSCNSPVALFAEAAVAREVHAPGGQQYNTVLSGIVESIPPGSTLFRTCLVLGDCAQGEVLTLIGRKGTGFWELRADYSVTTTSPTEVTVANVLVGEWNRAA